MPDSKQYWIPDAPPDAPNPFSTAIEPTAGDLYLTVDDLEDETVHMVKARWPKVGDDGRLDFGEPAYRGEGRIPDPTADVLTLERRAFEDVVVTSRTGWEQLGPTRPLRIGDTFWFRGSWSRPAKGVRRLSGEIVDITYAARAEVKAAQGWAIGGTPDFPEVSAPSKVESPPPTPGEMLTIEQKVPTIPGAVASPTI